MRRLWLVHLDLTALSNTRQCESTFHRNVQDLHSSLTFQLFLLQVKVTQCLCFSSNDGGRKKTNKQTEMNVVNYIWVHRLNTAHQSVLMKERRSDGFPPKSASHLFFCDDIQTQRPVLLITLSTQTAHGVQDALEAHWSVHPDFQNSRRVVQCVQDCSTQDPH